MKKILIVSATSRNNLILANNIKSLFDNINIVVDLVNLEEYNIPLYTPIAEKNSIPGQMESIHKKFVEASGFIICAPEYNGSIPPVLSNIISWLSVMGEDWRLVFNGKIGLMATHSGGSGNNLLQSLRIQLNHLGVVVLARCIIVNKKIEFDTQSAKEKINKLLELL
tara:strand:- start:653 stop:1153 length:501 start_codon:yes stop_codon:yes gene_type:complete